MINRGKAHDRRHTGIMRETNFFSVTTVHPQASTQLVTTPAKSEGKGPPPLLGFKCEHYVRVVHSCWGCREQPHHCATGVLHEAEKQESRGGQVLGSAGTYSQELLAAEINFQIHTDFPHH